MNLKVIDLIKSKYRVPDLDELGSGGFGVVYAGNVNEVPRAIKISRGIVDAEKLAMAEQELNVMKQPSVMDCPYIVQLIGVWRELGHLITVWELCEQSLAKRLVECQQKGLSGLPQDELSRYLREAAVGLDVINDLGVRHRDIKPDNILIVRGKAKIADLGLAVFVGASSLSKTASGTMGYIAPEAYGDIESKPEGERARGRLTKTVDIYAFAATAIKLTTGRDPFGSTPPVIIENQKTGRADTTGLTPAQADAALAALQPNPIKRPFATATEFVAAYLAVASQPHQAENGNGSKGGYRGLKGGLKHCDDVMFPELAVPDPKPVVSASVAPVKAFDFDIVGLIDSTESAVQAAVNEARRLEVACLYGKAAQVLSKLETHLRDNAWLRDLERKQARVDLLTPQIAEAVKTKQHRWIRPTVEELLTLLPHDQTLKNLRDKLPEFASEVTHPSGIKLKLILPGEFLMGTTPEQVKRLVKDISDFKAEYANDEQPQHRVQITQPFYCGVYPVTQGEWKAVMGSGNNPSHFEGNDRRPVDNVSWDMITKEFLPKANAMNKAAQLGTLRLPTEAEWECCCRAGTTTIFPWGDDVGRLGDHAWFDGNSDQQTHPVGEKQPNAWGLYDFLGQTWEWCQDKYDAELYGRRKGITVDPLQTTGSELSCLRGGSWNYVSRYTRSAVRNRYAPVTRCNYYGFRVMLPFQAVRTP